MTTTTFCRRTLRIAAATFVGCAPASVTVTQSDSGCRAENAYSQRLLSYVRDLVTTTDDQRVALRTSLGLKAMPATMVQSVTDSSVCARVAHGMNEVLQTQLRVRSIWVVKAGTDYAAVDPEEPAGEWYVTMTFDRDFRYMGAVAAP